MKKYECFDDLPGHLKRYIARFDWDQEEVERWLHRPIPALAERSILAALTDGDVETVNNVVLRTGDALGVTGYFD